MRIRSIVLFFLVSSSLLASTKYTGAGPGIGAAKLSDRVMIASGDALVTTTASGEILAGVALPSEHVLNFDATNDHAFISQFVYHHGMAISKITSSLAVAWSFAYPFNGAESSAITDDICATRDGGVVLIGTNGEAYVVAKLGADGAVQWAKRFGPRPSMRLHTIIETHDGGFLAAGTEHGASWLLRMSADGDVLWQKTYGIAPELRDAIELSDGDIVMTTSAAILRATNTGDVRWVKKLADGKFPQHLTALPDGAIAASCYIASPYVVFVLDRDGSLRWSRSLAPGSNFSSNNDLVLIDGNLWWVGAHEGNEPLTVVQLDLKGRSECASVTDASLQVTNAVSSADAISVDVSAFDVVSETRTLETTRVSVRAAHADCAEPKVAPPAVTNAFREETLATKNAERWVSLIRAKNFERLDEIAAEIRKKPWTSDPMHWDIEAFYKTIANPGLPETEALALFRGWVEQSPQSVTAHVALATALNVAAWKARGPGYTDSVNDSEWSQFDRLVNEARGTLIRANGAEQDPAYWTLRVELARTTGKDDPRAVMRSAAVYTHDPDMFQRAIHFNATQWGGSVAIVKSIVDEAARLTRADYGEALYMWLAYQSYVGQYADYESFQWDGKRVMQGCRDDIRLAPDWVPTYHRCALIARRFNDRAEARKLFESPQLGWYSGAELLWYARGRYEDARTWALRTPVEPFVDKPASQWPKIVAAGPNHTVSFVFRTEDGRVLTPHLKTGLHRNPFDLTTVSKPSTHVVRGRILQGLRDGGDRAYVVTCEWKGDECEQRVILAKTLAGGNDKRVLGFSQALDVVGAPVLDEEGYMIGTVSTKANYDEGHALYVFEVPTLSVMFGPDEVPQPRPPFTQKPPKSQP